MLNIYLLLQPLRFLKNLRLQRYRALLTQWKWRTNSILIGWFYFAFNYDWTALRISPFSSRANFQLLNTVEGMIEMYLGHMWDLLVSFIHNLYKLLYTLYGSIVMSKYDWILCKLLDINSNILWSLSDQSVWWKLYKFHSSYSQSVFWEGCSISEN